MIGYAFHLGEEGELLGDADGVGVALKKVGVRGLAKLIVVLEVVLNIPRLRKHPVAPVVHRCGV